LNFSLALAADALLSKICQNRRLLKGWVILSANFRYMGTSSTIVYGLLDRGVVQLQLLSLCSITWCCLCDPTFNRFDTIRACNRRSDGHTM